MQSWMGTRCQGSAIKWLEQVKENKTRELFRGADHAGPKPYLLDQGSQTFELVLRNPIIPWCNHAGPKPCLLDEGSQTFELVLRDQG